MKDIAEMVVLKGHEYFLDREVDLFFVFCEKGWVRLVAELRQFV